MKCLVTGAAGFIGSHLCEHLLQQGHEVIGVDAFIPYYSPLIKEQNLAPIRGHARFEFHGCDLRTDVLDELVDGVEVIFHEAAMAGLLRSWSDFDLYSSCNLLGTQRLLDAVRRSGQALKRFVYASTSSVYGRTASGDETMPTRPVSPYGVTKLAAEHLCQAYAGIYDLPLVILRYFSVYGPRQRPDMGYHRFIRSMLRDEPVTVTGDGYQVRSNTFVADCVRATVSAASAEPGRVYNVGGGESANVWEILQILEDLIGRPAKVQQQEPRPGDQRRTQADTTRIANDLGWHATTCLRDGLAQQVAWQREMLCRNGSSASPAAVGATTITEPHLSRVACPAS